MIQSDLRTLRKMFYFTSIAAVQLNTVVLETKLTFHLFDPTLPGDTGCSEVLKIPLKLDPFLKIQK